MAGPSFLRTVRNAFYPIFIPDFGHNSEGKFETYCFILTLRGFSVYIIYVYNQYIMSIFGGEKPYDIPVLAAPMSA